ncbi:unnamed protein product [Sphagnum balticum]
MSQSFHDMKDMMDRVNEAEAEKMQAEAGGGGGIKNIFAGRRNSRKTVAGNATANSNRTHKLTSDDISDPTPISSPQKPATIAVQQQPRKTQSDKPVTLPGFRAGDLAYQERNIDEEIVLRGTQGGVDDTNTSVRSDSSVHGTASTSQTPVSIISAGLQPRQGSNEFQAYYEEMRRRRQNNLYSARRNFINAGVTSPYTNNRTLVGGSADAAVSDSEYCTSGLSPMPTRLNKNASPSLTTNSSNDRDDATVAHESDTDRTGVSELADDAPPSPPADGPIDTHSMRRLDSLVRHSRHLLTHNAHGVSEQASKARGHLHELHTKQSESDAQIKRLRDERERIERELQREQHIGDGGDEAAAAGVSTATHESTDNPVTAANLLSVNVKTDSRGRNISPASTNSSSGVSTEPPTTLHKDHTTVINKIDRNWYDCSNVDTDHHGVFGHALSSSGQTLDSDSGCQPPVSSKPSPPPSMAAAPVVVSRIGHKLRFRAVAGRSGKTGGVGGLDCLREEQQSSGRHNKRDDPRRHTYTDIEQVRRALATVGPHKYGTKDGSKAHTTNTSTRIRTWFMASILGKSTPDLSDKNAALL